MLMFIVALFTIPKIQKQPSIDEWKKKMWYIYTMKYYSAVKKNKTLPLLTTQRDRHRGYYAK